jgi:glycosyltransferase involved in cell wall biosynthesis
MTKAKKSFIFTANRSFALVNSRKLLIQWAHSKNYEVHALVPQDKDIELLRNLGVTVHIVPLVRHYSMLSDFRLLLLYLYWFVRLQPDVVHNFNLKNVLVGSVAAFILPKKCSIINTITGLGSVIKLKNFKFQLFISVLKFSLKKASMNIFQNPDDLNELQQFVRLEGNSVVIVSSGVNILRFSPRIDKRPKNKNQDFICLFVGRLLKSKGLPLILEAADILLKDRSIRFVIVGEVDVNHSEAVDMADFLNRKNITIQGFTEEIEEVYRSADLFLFPSTYREGAPRVVLEAQSCGLPAIVSDYVGTRETIEDGLSGYLLEDLSGEMLASKICELKKNNDLYNFMSINARSRIEKMFSEQKIFKKYKKVYKELGLE